MSLSKKAFLVLFVTHTIFDCFTADELSTTSKPDFTHEVFTSADNEHTEVPEFISNPQLEMEQTTNFKERLGICGQDCNGTIEVTSKERQVTAERVDTENENLVETSHEILEQVNLSSVQKPSALDAKKEREGSSDYNPRITANRGLGHVVTVENTERNAQIDYWDISTEESTQTELCDDCLISSDAIIGLFEDVSVILFDSYQMPGNFCTKQNTYAGPYTCESWVNMIACVYEQFFHISNETSLNSTVHPQSTFSILLAVHEKHSLLNSAISTRLTKSQMDSVKSCFVRNPYLASLERRFAEVVEEPMRNLVEQVCIASVREQKIDLCVRYIQESVQYINVSYILDRVYPKSQGLQQIDAILRFVAQFDCETQLEAFKSLYQRWKEKFSFEGIQGVKFLNGVKACEFNSSFVEILQSSVDGFLTAIKHGIYSKNYKSFIAVLYENCSISMKSHWGDLVKKTFNGSVSNIDGILRFIDDLPCYIQSIECIAQLLKEMLDANQIDTKEFIMVASKFKSYVAKFKTEISVMPKYLQQFYGNNLTYVELKRRIPLSIQNLLWNGKECTIHNKVHGRLFAGWSEHSFDSNNGRIFWGPEGNRDRWNISPARDGWHLFTIFNTGYGVYMFASGHTLHKNNSYRYVFYYRSGVPVIPVSLWKIEPVENATYFTLINDAYDRQLVADDTYYYEDLQHRFVYIPKEAQSLGNIQDESRWLITC